MQGDRHRQDTVQYNTKQYNTIQWQNNTIQGKGYLSSRVASIQEGSHKGGSRTFGVSAGLVVNHGAVLGSEMSQEFREIRWCVEKEVVDSCREERKYLVDEMCMHVSRYVCM